MKLRLRLTVATLAVTVPMVLDINLQIGLSSALTPEVTIGEVTPARVAVSALAAQGEALVDGAGAPGEGERLHMELHLEG